MLSVRSILVAFTAGRDPGCVLDRALMLARRCHARLDLFACESEEACVLQELYAANAAEYQRRLGQAARRTLAWLERLRASADTRDVTVTREAVCETPLHEAVSRRVARSAPDLVIRSIGTGRNCTFGVADAELVRTCRVPLLLMRRKAWSTNPRVAAAIDISAHESPELVQRILQVATSVSAACGASLDVLYAGGRADASADAVDFARAVVAESVARADISTRDLFVVSDDPATAIPALVRRCAHDLLVLGGRTHCDTLTALVGSPAGGLLESVDADLLLVQPVPAVKTATLSAA